MGFFLSKPTQDDIDNESRRQMWIQEKIRKIGLQYIEMHDLTTLVYLYNRAVDGGWSGIKELEGNLALINPHDVTYFHKHFITVARIILEQVYGERIEFVTPYPNYSPILNINRRTSECERIFNKWVASIRDDEMRRRVKSIY